jgi:quercetin dioxygenase-like cupin family protein
MEAAADHHTVLLENERVRVLDSLVRPGEQTPIHTHRWPAVLQIIAISDFTRHDSEGNIIFDSRLSDTRVTPGQTVWSGPLAPHFVKNIGEHDIRVISIEIKD